MHKNIIPVILLLLLPLSVQGEGIVEVDDSIAGLGTEIRVSGVTQEADTLLIIPPKGATVSIPVTGGKGGEVRVQLPGKQATTAGMYRAVLARDGKQLSATVTFTILPDTLDLQSSSIESATQRIAANGKEEVRLTVTLRDQYGNPLDGRPVELLSSRPGDRIHPLERETDTKGEQHFLLTTEEPGWIALRAVDLLSGDTLDAASEVEAWGFPSGYPFNPYTASMFPFMGFPQQPLYQPPPTGRNFYYAQASTFDIIDHFEITVPKEVQQNLELPRIAIRAVDMEGRTVEDYTGTVAFSSTDPNATLPAFGGYTFVGRDLGYREFILVLKFQTPGEQVFRVEDTSNPAIFGKAIVTVIGDPNRLQKKGIELTSHTNDQFINTTAIVLEGQGPPFVNLVVTGGVEDVRGETDGDGHFVIPISLSPEQRDFTIRVRDDTARHDSGSLHLILDQVPPTLDSITFSPEKPAVSQNVLLVVQSEPALAKVALRLLDATTGETQELPATPNPSASGSYQLLFTAPQVGTHQPVVIALDRAGNTVEVRTLLNVVPSALPRVFNVRAQGAANAVDLEWDPLEEHVEGYRIYIGEEPANFLYTLDTGRPATSATVSGLNPGTVYYFAVTALDGGLESGEKSDVVSAEPLGSALTVTPGDGSLYLSWSFPQDMPLHSFTLEYGVEEGSYTEQRTLNGDLRTFTLRDLLNDITYFLHLIPITVTGDAMHTLAMVGTGTPESRTSGFHPAPLDPAPFGEDGEEIPPYLPQTEEPPPLSQGIRVPTTPPAGVPPLAWWTSIVSTLSLIGFLWYRRMRLRQSAAFLQSIQNRYHQ